MSQTPGHRLAAYLHPLRLFSRDVRLYLVTFAVNGMVEEGIWAVLLNLYLLRLGYDPGFIGLVNALATLSFIICSLPAGLLVTRWGSRRAMVLGIALLIAGYGLLSVAAWIPTAGRQGWLLGTTALRSTGLALFWVSSTPFLVSATGPDERTHAFSVLMALTPLAGFAGSLMGGVLPAALATGLRLPPDDPAPYGLSLLLGALLLAPGLLAVLATREVRDEPIEHPANNSGPAPYGPIVLIALIVALANAANVGMVFFNVYLDDAFRTSTAAIGAISAGAQLLSVPTALAIPLLVARWGHRKTVVLGALGNALSAVLMAFVPSWGGASVGFTGLWVMSSIWWAPMQVHSQRIVSPSRRGMMSGAVLMASGVSIFALSLGGGHIITNHGYAPLFMLGAGLGATGALLFWASTRGQRGEIARGGACGRDSVEAPEPSSPR